MKIDKKLMKAIVSAYDEKHTLEIKKEKDEISVEIEGSPLVLLFHAMTLYIEIADDFDAGHLKNLFNTAKALAALKNEAGNDNR